MDFSCPIAGQCRDILIIFGPLGVQNIQQPGGAWQHVIPDALGSVRGVVDASDATLYACLYSPTVANDELEAFDPLTSAPHLIHVTGPMYNGRHRSNDHSPGCFWRPVRVAQPGAMP